ncbi:PDZ domain-containing protein [Psychromonas sp. MME1]|uniref:PDZ domain-containing protein n=1 Tax=Psychromonas sp. MME1 TaxID=3231032 RepID=UPI0034E2C23A
MSPVREDNEIKGYRVSPGKDKDLFEEAGLQSGDLAVEVNGVDLTDMQEALGLMKMLPTMSEITLTVERGGELHEIYFTVP